MDLCFRVTGDIQSLQKALEGAGVTILERPVRQTGARGPIHSFYIRDPDGNLLEFSTPAAH